MDVLLCSLVSWHPFSTGWNSAYLLGLNSGLTSSVKLFLTIPALTDLSSLQSLPKPRMCPAQSFAALLSFRTSVHISGLKLPEEQNTVARIHDLNHSQNLGHIVGIQKLLVHSTGCQILNFRSSIKSGLRNSMLPVCTPSISCIKTYLIISMQIWPSNSEYLTLSFHLCVSRAQHSAPTQQESNFYFY